MGVLFPAEPINVLGISCVRLQRKSFLSSMGSMIAQFVAIKAGSLVERLILCATHVGGQSAIMADEKFFVAVQAIASAKVSLLYHPPRQST